MAELPTYGDLPVSPGAPPGSSWGVWGDGDVFGALNLLAPERVLRAARCIRTGRSFPLGLDLDLPDPPLFDRGPPHHEVVRRPDGAFDDVLHEWNTQSSAQWDGFRHFGHRRHGHYAGLPAEMHGVHHWAQRGIVGRAVLADVARWRAASGAPIEPGEPYAISASDLDACLTAEGVAVETGDILLVRTGWLAWYRSLDHDAREAYARQPDSPGLAGREIPQYLWDLHVAAVAADNPAVEVIPGAPGEFLHPHLIALLGIPLGELWDLDDLAADCAAEGTYDCFLASAPLHLTGGAASPPNAVAVR